MLPGQNGSVVSRTMMMQEAPNREYGGNHIVDRMTRRALLRTASTSRQSFKRRFFGPSSACRISTNGTDSDIQQPWGSFVQVPVLLVMVDVIAVAVQFTVYLTAVGWVESEYVGSSDLFVRGLLNYLVPGWSVAIYATIAEFLNSEISFCGGFCSILLFTACCTGIAAVPGYEPGIVVQVMGGAIVHFVIICVYVPVKKGCEGHSMKESIYGIGYFITLFLIAVILFFWDCAICILLPVFDKKAQYYSNGFEQPQKGAVSMSPGLALSVACIIGEGGAVVVVKRLDMWFYKRIPNSRPMGSWVVMVIHSVSESFRLATLWYSAIVSPESNIWISALISSLVLNIVTRMGWQSYFAWRLTCNNTFWIPGCWTFVHREAKFAFGYCRFGAPIAVAGARYILSYVSKSESLCCTSEISPYFNETVLHVWIGSFVEKFMEDTAIMLCEWNHLVPSLYTNKSVKAFTCTSRANLDTSVAMWYPPDPHSKLVHKVIYQEDNFKSRIVHLGITSAATFLVHTGLIPLVSLDFLLGFSGEYVSAVEDMERNGGLVWRLAGEYVQSWLEAG